MPAVDFFPIDIDYTTDEAGKGVIRLFGRTVDGKQVCVLDDSLKPYFWIIPKEKESMRSLMKKVEGVKVADKQRVSHVVKTEIEKKKYFGEELEAIKVTVQHPKDVKKIKDVVRKLDGVNQTAEADIQFYKRYLLDKKLTPLMLCHAEGDIAKSDLNVDVVLRAKKITQSEEVILKQPRILAFDIEVYNVRRSPDVEKDPIVMVAFADNKDFEKVITWKEFQSPKKYIEFVKDEKALINKFKEVIKEYKPDYITGYFSDGFDLPYIKTRAEHYGIKLDINIDKSKVRFSSRGQTQTAKTTGFAHIDIFRFIRRVMATTLRTDNYDLDTIAQEILGEGKKEKIDVADLHLAWDKDHEKLKDFCEYNLIDAKLTVRLTNKMLPNLNEVVKVIGQPMQDICRMTYGQLVELYLMKHVQEYNEIIPNRPFYTEMSGRDQESYEGAFVYEPEPGLYKDVVVFDFRSLYPTMIVTHNICVSTITNDKKDAKKTPDIEVDGKKQHYYFNYKKDGFMPLILKEIIMRRRRVKDIIKKQTKFDPVLNARQETLKFLANSFYGYFGFSGSRWYSNECAASISAYGRYYIQLVIKKAKKEGFKVIYSDSLPYDRRVFVKTSSGDIKIKKIGEIYGSPIKGLQTLTYTKNKETKFKPIKRAIRHKLKRTGKLLKLTTKYGTTVVTNKHSVYAYKKGKVILSEASKLKKEDFLISLTNPRINVKYKKGYIFDMTDLELGSAKNKLMLYKDLSRFPRKKGKCPLCKKMVLLSSHAFLEHKDRKEKFHKKSKSTYVGTMHAKGGRIPRYWILDEDLAWILGFYCADGSASSVKTKTGYKNLISFGGQDLNLIKKTKSILDKKIGCNLKIIKNYDSRNKEYMYYYRIQRIPLVALFEKGFGAGKGSEFKKVPHFIFTSEEKLQKAFVKGYLDGDGNKNIDKRYKTKFIKISTKSKELAIGLQFILKSLRHKKTHWKKEMKHIAWTYRADKPKINTLRLQSARYCRGNFCLAEITNIKRMPYQEYVYDLEVADSHNFVDAEGMMLVHNTDSIFLTLKKKTRKEAMTFISQVNRELPSLMELEFENYYPHGIFVMKKGDMKGAKKKYALIDEQDNIKVTGFETVRGDWSLLAKEVQRHVLEIVLKEFDKEKALKYVKDMVKKIEKKQIPMEKMVIQKQLRKAIKDYEAIGPHVVIAKRLVALGEKVGPGSVVKYVVDEGKGIIRDRAKLVEEARTYDAEYYINHQVIPAVISIFEVLGYDKKAFTDQEQSRLGDF